jgi:hypothetical protein
MGPEIERIPQSPITRSREVAVRPGIAVARGNHREQHGGALASRLPGSGRGTTATVMLPRARWWTRKPEAPNPYRQYDSERFESSWTARDVRRERVAAVVVGHRRTRAVEKVPSESARAYVVRPCVSDIDDEPATCAFNA